MMNLINGSEQIKSCSERRSDELAAPPSSRSPVTSGGAAAGRLRGRLNEKRRCFKVDTGGRENVDLQIQSSTT